jgi:hypothetical protein
LCRQRNGDRRECGQAGKTRSSSWSSSFMSPQTSRRTLHTGVLCRPPRLRAGGRSAKATCQGWSGHIRTFRFGCAKSVEKHTLGRCGHDLRLDSSARRVLPKMSEADLLRSTRGRIDTCVLRPREARSPRCR